MALELKSEGRVGVIWPTVKGRVSHNEGTACRRPCGRGSLASMRNNRAGWPQPRGGGWARAAGGDWGFSLQEAMEDHWRGSREVLAEGRWEGVHLNTISVLQWSIITITIIHNYMFITQKMKENLHVMLALAPGGIKYHFIISVIANLFIIIYSVLTMCQALQY